MKSLSEIETTSKRASRAVGFSWGIAEEVGKCIRLLELFGFPGIKNLNQYYQNKKKEKRRQEEHQGPPKEAQKALTPFEPATPVLQVKGKESSLVARGP